MRLTPIQQAIVNHFDGNQATTVQQIANELTDADWDLEDMGQLCGVIEIVVNELVRLNVIHRVSVESRLLVLTEGARTRQGRRLASVAS